MNLNRRQFVGAASVLAAGSVYGASPKTQAPKRVIFICSSLGFYSPMFFPKKAVVIESSEYLKNMRSLNKMTVFENFFHPGMKASNHDSEKSLLTGTPHPESSSFKNTISIDQKMAEVMGRETRIPSLSLAISDRGWGQSWSETGSAIPPIYEEEKLYKMLFGKEDLKEVAAQLHNDQQIIKALEREASSLKRDETALKRYQRNLNQLKLRLERRKYWLNKPKPQVANTLSQDKTYPFSTRIKNLLNLSKEAFRTDSTRVISLSMEFIEGAIKVPGATGSWHALSHHNNSPKALKSLQAIEADILKNVEQFLFDLDQIKEGRGTLLDNTTVFISSNLGDASKHTQKSLPTIIAGGGYNHKSHIKMAKDTPLCNLYLELLNQHGLDAGKFGTSQKNMGLLQG